jgi:hypothetical protein
LVVRYQTKVIDTLYAVEDKYPRARRTMLDTFFSGEVRKGEMEKWETYEAKADALDGKSE